MGPGVRRYWSLLEVFGVHVLEELAELLDLLFLLPFIGDEDAGFGDDVFVREDPATEPHGERDRVARARGHLVRAPVALHVDRRVERSLAQLGDRDALDLD